MKSQNMTQLFDKLDDLKAVFSYGQKIIPIIQNLVDFMQETVPLIETINQSILDSANKMPNAYYQINDVTHANEVATSEILDLVDTISNEISILEKDLGEESKMDEDKNKLISAISDSFSGDAELQSKFDELIKLGNFNTDNSKLLNSISKIKEDAYSITLSLQVQDITSQQLSAVNHLIQSVQLKLSSLIEDIDTVDLTDEKLEMIKPNKQASYDENASYTKNKGSQGLADSLINSNSNNSQASQDEIDKLFS